MLARIIFKACSRNFSQRIVFAFFSLILFPTISLAQEGIELLQRTAMGGEYVIDATANALKITKKGTSISIFARAPNWTVFVYNKASKKFFDTPPEKFQGSFANTFYAIRGDDPKSLHWVETGAIVCCGLPAIHLLTKREDKEKVPHYSMKEWQGSTRGDCIVLKEPLLPKAVISIICKYYGIPAFDRLPLGLTHSQPSHTSLALKTIQAKKLSLSDKDFEQPKNFVKAKSEADVIYDPDEIPVL